MASNSPTESQSPSQVPNVVLYLPPGPLFQGHATPVSEDVNYDEHSQHQQRAIDKAAPSGISPQQALASMTYATVVTVNYRLGAVLPTTSNEETTQTHPISPPPSQSLSNPPFYQYPTPIHDTLAAFDWIQTNLHPTNLGIIGSHIGGSLALMLALTEAQSVKAVASIMPVCDWPGLDEYCTTAQPSRSASETLGKTTKRASKKKTLRANAPSDLVPLLAAREALFASPERCFDAFASPVLFLRSAGRDVPPAFPKYTTGPGYPVPVLKDSRHVVDGSLLDPEFDPLDAEGNGFGEEGGHPTIRRRKALSRWPPYGLDYGVAGRGWDGNGVKRLEVTLPWVRVYIDGAEGKENGTVLADQGEEMVSVMRRACFFGREKGFGERRVGLVRDLGVMGSGLELGEDVGGWFGGIFDGRIRDE